ncbi:MAG: hypothetical protein KA731_00590 [Candidatus Moranbacteria bacterium]|nr:hypothetical protein [Candidatus Moranbacteria bacterium]MBP6033916.1 hypothetical protein [Candidatus Moranbacteria bacterium]MBP7695625.1 hypothetical protein [Candidatus Moranbacteria bacterium]
MAVWYGFGFGFLHGAIALCLSVAAFGLLLKWQRRDALLREAVEWANRRQKTAFIEQRNRCESELRRIFQTLRDRYGMSIEDARQHIREMRQARR